MVSAIDSAPPPARENMKLFAQRKDKDRNRLADTSRRSNSARQRREPVNRDKAAQLKVNSLDIARPPIGENLSKAQRDDAQEQSPQQQDPKSPFGTEGAFSESTSEAQTEGRTPHHDLDVFQHEQDESRRVSTALRNSRANAATGADEAEDELMLDPDELFHAPSEQQSPSTGSKLRPHISTQYNPSPPALSGCRSIWGDSGTGYSSDSSRPTTRGHEAHLNAPQFRLDAGFEPAGFESGSFPGACDGHDSLEPAPAFQEVRDFIEQNRHSLPIQGADRGRHGSWGHDRRRPQDRHTVHYQGSNRDSPSRPSSRRGRNGDATTDKAASFPQHGPYEGNRPLNNLARNTSPPPPRPAEPTPTRALEQHTPPTADSGAARILKVRTQMQQTPALLNPSTFSNPSPLDADPRPRRDPDPDAPSPTPTKKRLASKLSHHADTAPLMPTRSKRRHNAPLDHPPNDDAPLDYAVPALWSMPFPDLRDEPFDKNPAAPPDPSRRGFGDSQPLHSRLAMSAQLQPAEQARFFASLSLAEWEEAGTWFKDRFAEHVDRLAEIRRGKREMAKRYEEEVARRYERVREEEVELDGALEGLRKDGGLVLRNWETPGRG